MSQNQYERFSAIEQVKQVIRFKYLPHKSLRLYEEDFDFRAQYMLGHKLVTSYGSLCDILSDQAEDSAHLNVAGDQFLSSFRLREDIHIWTASGNDTKDSLPQIQIRKPSGLLQTLGRVGGRQKNYLQLYLSSIVAFICSLLRSCSPLFAT